jgi:hypothetical protein
MNDSQAYAAVLYAITSARPDMPAPDRARLADAIVEELRERGLIAE